MAARIDASDRVLHLGQDVSVDICCIHCLVVFADYRATLDSVAYCNRAGFG